MLESQLIRIAINRLVSDASCNLSGSSYSDIEWTDQRPIFTEDEFNAEVQKVRDEVNESVSKRVYPSVEDQLDALWHAMNAGLIPKAENFYQMIKEVKDKHPKPE